MAFQYRVLQSHEIQASKSHQGFALDILIGLSQPAKSISTSTIPLCAMALTSDARTNISSVNA